MDYKKGSIKRVFAVRVDHGEDVIAGLSALALKEGIKSAFFIMLGAMSDAELVTGPKEKAVPPTTMWSKFDDAREIIVAGSIFWEKGKPKIHLHGAAGSSRGMVMGCFREKAQAFMVVEVFMVEMDIVAERVFDEKMGASLMRFG
jgi:predicted DNA-binding protein with PD1-like motif